MTDRIYIYMTQLPDGVNSFTTPCYDGYTVYIDPRLDKAGQMRAYQDELNHIYGNDFEKEDVQEIESKSHFAAREVLK